MGEEVEQYINGKLTLLMLKKRCFLILRKHVGNKKADL